MFDCSTCSQGASSRIATHAAFNSRWTKDSFAETDSYNDFDADTSMDVLDGDEDTIWHSKSPSQDPVLQPDRQRETSSSRAHPALSSDSCPTEVTMSSPAGRSFSRWQPSSPSISRLPEILSLGPNWLLVAVFAVLATMVSISHSRGAEGIAYVGGLILIMFCHGSGDRIPGPTDTLPAGPQGVTSSSPAVGSLSLD